MTRACKLLILLLMLALMILLYADVVNNAAEEDAEENDESELTVLASFDPEDAESVSWTFEGESGKESYSLKKEEGTWVWPENAGLKLDQEAVDSLLRSAAEPSAERVFTPENVADLSEYGMDEPACSVTITFSEESGQEPVTIRIGDYNSIACGYYIMVDGDCRSGLTDGTLAEMYSRSPETLEYVEEAGDSEEETE
ncbi:MAG: DUF4340 domain-containing protein [Firmicutes bacterium]|nr:DUF4340 domain-containing protein [Bacillota bacterium]